MREKRAHVHNWSASPQHSTYALGPPPPAPQEAAARVFMFVADAPTTTTQRLKSMATGGLPSFFDVGNSFAAGAVEDDNLVDQLAAAGRRPVSAVAVV